MKKKIFEPGLFRDAMRQLRIGGMFAALILLLQAVLLPIGKVVNENVPSVRTTVGFMDVFPGSLLLFWLVAPLMTLYLFRFLTQRSASDFYHSIPQTRLCLYFSFTAAVFCWSVILLLAGTLTGTLVHMLFPEYFHVPLKSMGLGCLQIAACVLFVIGAVMLAVNLTGNILANLAVSLLIIFIPRLFMLVVKYYVGDSLTIVNDEFLSFMGNGWNQVTDSVFGLISRDSVGFDSSLSRIYTGALGLIYLGLGAYLFHRRRSEAAGEASISPGLQLVFRLLPAAAFCLIPNVQVFSVLSGSRTPEAYTIYTAGVLYLAGVILYFLYELLSTRKVRNLRRAVPGVLVLLGFNLLVVFGMMGLRRNLLSYTPSAEEIDYVQLVGRQDVIWGYDDGFSPIPGYLSSRQEKIRLTDENVKQLVAARLKETVAYDSTPVDERVIKDFDIREVVIHSRGREMHRNILLLKADVKLLAKSLSSNSQIQDIYMKLPDASEVRLTLDAMEYEYGNDGLIRSATGEELQKIYLALQEDAEDMGFERWYTYCENPRNMEFVLYMQIQEEGESLGSAFHIGKETPKARQACLETCWNMQETARKQALEDLLLLKELQESGQEGIVVTYNDIWISAVSEDGTGDFIYYIDATDRKQTEALAVILEKYAGKELTPGMPLANIGMNVEYALGADGDTEAGDSVLLENGTDVFSTVSWYLLFPLPTEEELNSFRMTSG